MIKTGDCPPLTKEPGFAEVFTIGCRGWRRMDMDVKDRDGNVLYTVRFSCKGMLVSRTRISICDTDGTELRSVTATKTDVLWEQSVHEYEYPVLSASQEIARMKWYRGKSHGRIGGGEVALVDSQGALMYRATYLFPAKHGFHRMSFAVVDAAGGNIGVFVEPVLFRWRYDIRLTSPQPLLDVVTLCMGDYLNMRLQDNSPSS